MSDKKYSNLHPKQLLKLKKALEIGATSSLSTQKREREKLRKEAMDEAKLKVKKKVQTLRWKDRKAKDSD